MNYIYKKFLQTSQEVLEQVKDLTFLGNPVLIKVTSYSSFKEALAICKKL